MGRYAVESTSSDALTVAVTALEASMTQLLGEGANMNVAQLTEGGLSHLPSADIERTVRSENDETADGRGDTPAASGQHANNQTAQNNQRAETSQTVPNHQVADRIQENTLQSSPTAYDRSEGSDENALGSQYDSASESNTSTPRLRCMPFLSSPFSKRARGSLQRT